VAVVAASGLGLAACGSDDDAQPTVASVSFEPRLVVLVGDDQITAEAGTREGATIVHGDESGDWRVPDGSVVELRVDADEPVRVVADRVPPGGTEASPLVDTGTLDPGDAVTLALTEPGRVVIRFLDDDPDEERLVLVVSGPT